MRLEMKRIELTNVEQTRATLAILRVSRKEEAYGGGFDPKTSDKDIETVVAEGLAALSSLPAKTQIFTARNAKHAITPLDNAQTKATYTKTMQGEKRKGKDNKQLVVKKNKASADRDVEGPLTNLRGWLYQVHGAAVEDARTREDTPPTKPRWQRPSAGVAGRST